MQVDKEEELDNVSCTIQPLVTTGITIYDDVPAYLIELVSREYHCFVPNVQVFLGPAIITTAFCQMQNRSAPVIKNMINNAIIQL